jgi:hypothetical protein
MVLFLLSVMVTDRNVQTLSEEEANGKLDLFEPFYARRKVTPPFRFLYAACFRYPMIPRIRSTDSSGTSSIISPTKLAPGDKKTIARSCPIIIGTMKAKRAI